MREPFKEGIRLFNEAYFKDAHEEWEVIWKPLSASPGKLFLQGLIMIAAALHKYGKKEYPGMERLMSKGVRLVSENRREAFDMDTENFLADIRLFWDKYKLNEKAGLDLPKIRTKKNAS